MGLKTVLGEEKKGFLRTESSFLALSSPLAALPGRTRAAAVIDWLCVCTCGFLLPRGRGEILLSARSDIYEQKRLITMISRFCPLWWLLELQSSLL